MDNRYVCIKHLNIAKHHLSITVGVICLIENLPHELGSLNSVISKTDNQLLGYLEDFEIEEHFIREDKYLLKKKLNTLINE